MSDGAIESVTTAWEHWQTYQMELAQKEGWPWQTPQMELAQKEGWPFTWNHSIRILLPCADGQTRPFRRFFAYDGGKFVGSYTMSEAEQ
jgi:hypothetical protein